MNKVYGNMIVKNVITFIILIGFAFIATIPAFYHTAFKVSWDAGLHLARIEQIYSSLVNWQLPSPISFIGQNDQLSAFSSMYPWITALIFVIPKFIVSNTVYSLFLGYLFLNVLTNLNAFLLMKRFSKKVIVIFAGVVIYEFNGYHLIQMFARGALGEALAYAFVPLVLLGCYKVWNKEHHSWIILGLGMGALANSHVLTLVFATLLLAVIELVRFIQKKFDFYELISFIKAALVAFLTSVYSLGNIVNILMNNTVIKPFTGLTPIKTDVLFGYIVNNKFYESQDTWSLGLGCSLLIIFMIIFKISHNVKGNWWNWLLASMCSIVIGLNIFPTKLLDIYPVNMIQFTGRILGLSALLLSISVVIFLTKEHVSNKNVTYLIIVLTFFSCSSLYIYERDYTNPTLDGGVGHFSLSSSNFNTLLKKHTQFPNDYLPSKKEQKLSVDLKQSSEIKTQLIERKYDSNMFVVTAKKSGKFEMKLAKYNSVNYLTFVNGNKLKTTDKSKMVFKFRRGRNIVLIKAPASDSSKITFVISMLAILLFSSVLLIDRLKAEERKKYIQ